MKPSARVCLPLRPASTEAGRPALEEAFEAVSWTQLCLQDKPTGFLDINGFLAPTMAQLDLMVTEG